MTNTVLPSIKASIPRWTMASVRVSMEEVASSRIITGGSATATGMVISAATLFDIGWNAVFGALMDRMGAGNAYLLLPAAMALFFACCVFLLQKRRLR